MLHKQTIATWGADNDLPGKAPNGDTSTRYTLPGVPLRPGDVLTIEGHPDDGSLRPSTISTSRLMRIPAGQGKHNDELTGLLPLRRNEPLNIYEKEC